MTSEIFVYVISTEAVIVEISYERDEKINFAN